MMKVIDFHPDDLLDREIEGTLSIEERRRLRDHLDRCPQCELERQLRSDFEAELGSREDATSIQSFVSGALRAARSPAARRPRGKKSIDAWRRRFVFLFAATMVLATGLAAAEVEFAGRAWHAAREKIAFAFRLSDPRPPRETTISSPSPAGPALSPVEVAAPVLEARRVEETAAPELPATKEHHAIRSKTQVITPTPADETPAAAPAPELGARLDSAPALFDEANAARRHGRMLEAAALYRDLQARHPTSSEARLSIAVVARMELDLGEAAAAASGFSAYLATGDRALREEAMAGRAMALGRLGQNDEEAAAWRELLHSYPGSSYAKVARARLGQDLP